MSWCSSWSNSLWQGWSFGLVHCPGGNGTDLIWRVLASSQGISSWTPLKPQHSNPNPNPNPLANKLWCSDFLTPPTPLIIPFRFPAFLESVLPLKKLMVDSCKMLQKQSEEFHTNLWHIFQWRHRILWHCNRSTTRGHAGPVPLYHLSRLRT